MSGIAVGYDVPWNEYLAKKYRYMDDTDTRIERNEAPEFCPICDSETIIENDHYECSKCAHWVDFKD